MMRYDIEETAVYIQVRTVVWEDGAARPLLPDPWAEGRAPDPPDPPAPEYVGVFLKLCPTKYGSDSTPKKNPTPALSAIGRLR